MNNYTGLKIIFSTLLIILSAAIAPAQQTNNSSEPTISPEKKALIKEYIKATGGREQIKKTLDAVFANINNSMPLIFAGSVNADSKLTEDQKAAILKNAPEMVVSLTKRLRDGLDKELDLAKVIEDINYPLLDKFFTEAELKDLVVFYKSPTGQKAISRQPEIYTEATTKLNAILIPAVQKVMKTATEEEIAERVKKAKQTK